MINQELVKKLVEVGSQWVCGERFYAFETRMFRPLSEFQYPQGGFVAIIDVQGFSRNEKFTDPIKLHYEEVFSTPDLFNLALTQEQIDAYAYSLPEKLKSFKSNAYSQFEGILKNEVAKGKIYSSDPYHWESIADN